MTLTDMNEYKESKKKNQIDRLIDFLGSTAMPFTTVVETNDGQQRWKFSRLRPSEAENPKYQINIVLTLSSITGDVESMTLTYRHPAILVAELHCCVGLAGAEDDKFKCIFDNLKSAEDALMSRMVSDNVQAKKQEVKA